MSAFTAAEIAYLTTQRIGRLATVGPDAQPHVVPVGFRYNQIDDTIEIGGRGGFAARKKYRDVVGNPRVGLVVDDVPSVDPWTVRGIEVRGEAQVLATGGEALGPGFDPEMFRIRPSRIVSWGIDTPMLSPRARSVGTPPDPSVGAPARRAPGRDRVARTTDGISASRFHASEGVGDWRVVGDGACARFPTGSCAAGARFVQAISQIPGVEDHPPDIDVRPDGVTVRLVTYGDDYYGMSQRDVEMARQVSAAARRLGLSADPSHVQSVLVIPGAPSPALVMPFWQAALGYEPRRDSPTEDLVDPHGRGPGFWFERMQAPRGDGGGAIHVAVWVPYEQAAERVAAALAAGGRMVRDEFAPSWWTLADAAGNEVDIATARGRD